MIATFEVERNNLRHSRLVDDPHAPGARALAEGEARLRIDCFALTANNITYAAFGDAMKYWEFFPTGDAAWGNIPVWGFAEVAESRTDGVTVGERCYGYWPMGQWLVIQPERIGRGGFVDASAHRGNLPAAYNRVQRCAADPGYRAAQEAQQAILRPLFTTSFLIDDFLAEQRFFGATQVLLSSASSKTAYGTAFCLSRRRGDADAPRIIGLTSAGNAEFCRSLGCYDEVRVYDRLGELAASTASVYVDFAGNAELRRSVHVHFGDALRYSCSVGGTHWNALGSGRDLPGPRPTLFFAPAQLARRSAAPPEGWGPEELNRRLAEAWLAFMQPVNDPVSPWLRVRRGQGADAVRDALLALLEGSVDPRDGFMLTL
jgi:hypothetical protein